MFCDLRGFTGFTENTEPEDMIRVLRAYHEAMGEEAFRFGGTVGRFAGDGLMIFFNDPLPIPDPAARAVRMGVAMRSRMDGLLAGWRSLAMSWDSAGSHGSRDAGATRLKALSMSRTVASSIWRHACAAGRLGSNPAGPACTPRRKISWTPSTSATGAERPGPPYRRSTRWVCSQTGLDEVAKSPGGAVAEQ